MIDFKSYKLNKKDLLIFLVLVVAYFVTRLINLGDIPIFTDEAIYLRWAQVGSFDAAWRYIPLTDGKPPLYHWFVMLTIRLISDPLIAGRIVSVASGFISLIGIWLLTQTLFKNKTTSHLAAALYLTSPMMLVYDRLAIVDSLLTTTSIYSLLFATLVVKTKRLDTALLMGAAIGAGMLTKASGLLFLLLSPATILIGEWNKKKWVKPLLTWMALLLIAAIISQLTYSILRLSQFFYRIGQKNHEFILTFDQFFSAPFSLTFGNAKSLLRWQIQYLTIPLSIIIFCNFFSKKFWQEKLVLLGYYFGPFLLIASFNKIIFPRFLLFSTPWLIILAALGLEHFLHKLKKSQFKYLALILFLLVPVKDSLFWITNPIQSHIPQADKDQYFQGKPSGHGVLEIVEIVKGEAQNNPVFLGTDGTFGLTPDAFHVYLQPIPNIEVKGYYPVHTIPEEVVNLASEKTVYFVYYNLQDIPLQDNIELVAEYPKVTPTETTYLRIYRVYNKE